MRLLGAYGPYPGLTDEDERSVLRRIWERAQTRRNDVSGMCQELVDAIYLRDAQSDAYRRMLLAGEGLPPIEGVRCGDPRCESLH